MTADQAAYKSMLMQNHRLRVQLHLERKGLSTLNMPRKAIQYICDGFIAGMLPDQVAEHLEVLLPIWEKDDETRHRVVQSHQQKVY